MPLIVQQVFRAVAAAAAGDVLEAQRVQQAFVVGFDIDVFCPLILAARVIGLYQAVAVVEGAVLDGCQVGRQHDAFKAVAILKEFVRYGDDVVAQGDLPQPGTAREDAGRGEYITIVSGCLHAGEVRLLKAYAALEGRITEVSDTGQFDGTQIHAVHEGVFRDAQPALGQGDRREIARLDEGGRLQHAHAVRNGHAVHVGIGEGAGADGGRERGHGVRAGSRGREGHQLVLGLGLGIAVRQRDEGAVHLRADTQFDEPVRLTGIQFRAEQHAVHRIEVGVARIDFDVLYRSALQHRRRAAQADAFFIIAVIIAGIITKGHHLSGQSELRQAAAAREDEVVDVSEAVRQGYAGQIDAVFKGAFVDGIDAVQNLHGRDVAVVGEGVHVDAVRAEDGQLAVFIQDRGALRIGVVEPEEIRRERGQALVAGLDRNFVPHVLGAVDVQRAQTVAFAEGAVIDRAVPGIGGHGDALQRAAAREGIRTNVLRAHQLRFGQGGAIRERVVSHIMHADQAVDGFEVRAVREAV